MWREGSWKAAVFKSCLEALIRHSAHFDGVVGLLRGGHKYIRYVCTVCEWVMTLNTLDF